MHRYFKLVALNDPKWLLQEFLEGRARFGWSGPGMDLRSIQAKERRDRSDQEQITWRYTQFLLNRIAPGDRVVLQFHQPIQEFVIGEVTDEEYEFDGAERDDFNHILHIRPLTSRPIDINSKIIPEHLKHDLTKRGHYYQIYPKTSVRKLEEIVDEKQWLSPGAESTRTTEDDLDATRLRLRAHAIQEIANQWKGKSFESFCERLCEAIEYVEVTDPSDRGQGWDLLLRIINPVTGTMLLDDVPVQCKNYYGEVQTSRPIEDLKRCVENTESSIAYLFILGELPDDFWRKIELARLEMEQELDRSIDFVVVDQDQIATLYLRYMAALEPVEPEDKSLRKTVDAGG